MVVNGREIRFKRTILANCNIIDKLAGGDAENLDRIFDGGYVKSQKAAADFIVEMNAGYETSQTFTDKEYVPRPLTQGEVLSLEESEFETLFTEALSVWTGEKVTIETEPVKTGKKTELKKVKSD